MHQVRVKKLNIIGFAVGQRAGRGFHRWIGRTPERRSEQLLRLKTTGINGNKITMKFLPDNSRKLTIFNGCNRVKPIYRSAAKTAFHNFGYWVIAVDFDSD